MTTKCELFIENYSKLFSEVLEHEYFFLENKTLIACLEESGLNNILKSPILD